MPADAWAVMQAFGQRVGWQSVGSGILLSTSDTLLQAHGCAGIEEAVCRAALKRETPYSMFSMACFAPNLRLCS